MAASVWGPSSPAAFPAALLASSIGDSLIGTMAAGAGARLRTQQSVNRDTVNVLGFTGADSSGVTDSYAAFQAAINSLPTGGGKITIGPGTWRLETEPTWGNRSMYWDISPSAKFIGAGTGTGKFPYMETNAAQLAVGPFIQSRSTEVSGPTPNGGIAAWNVEMIQPSTYIGQSVAGYYGAAGSNPNPSANVWVHNLLIRADAGAGGTYQGSEVDVDCFSSTALMKGISINGIGTFNPTVALEIIRSDATLYKTGVNIRNSIIGLKIESTSLDRGIVIGNVVGIGNTLLTGQQLVNGADCVVLQRATDSSPTGDFIRCVDAANSKSLFDVNILGQLANTGLTARDDSPVGYNAVVLQNESIANNTTKTVVQQFKGRDTVSTLKTLVECKVAPGTANWTTSSYTISTRVADALGDSWQIDTVGNSLVTRVGAGLRVKEGSNAKQGTAVLAAGSVVVANTSVTATSRILLTSNIDGGTPGWLRVSARTVGTSFTITSSSGADTSTVAYQIFEPA